MTSLEELIEAANKLCSSLDIASNNEKTFSYNICHELERMSWETLRLANDLKLIKEYQGGF